MLCSMTNLQLIKIYNIMFLSQSVYCSWWQAETSKQYTHRELTEYSFKQENVMQVQMYKTKQYKQWSNETNNTTFVRKADNLSHEVQA